MAQESIAVRCDAIDDPQASRAMIALLTSILTDLTALMTAHNTHQHAALNAVPSVALMGNLNTLK